MDSGCFVRAQDLSKLNESTRKLLGLLEEIQSKTRSKEQNQSENNDQIFFTRSNTATNTLVSVTDKIGEYAFKKLEYQAKHLDAIYANEDDDDCSGYKRLTRKCHCLNRREFNDFVIHFNEDVKYFTNNSGEIIKNMRILKKFLYMGGSYTKNALLFLNEALSEAKLCEKVDIINGCSHADVCNIFAEHTIITSCIRFSQKTENFSDAVIQGLTATFLHRLAQVEEGRRYLNFSSKIESDIKKLLRKKSSKLEYETLESLNAVLNLLHKSINEHAYVSYYCRPHDKGMSSSIIDVIQQYRRYMTLDELLKHLNLLNIMSANEIEKSELTSNLPIIIKLFKNLLLEFDNSEMNIVLINILNNTMTARTVVTKEIIRDKLFHVDKCTQPSKTVPERIPQIPQQIKKRHKLKLDFGFTSKPRKCREKSNTMIVVPLEKKHENSL